MDKRKFARFLRQSNTADLLDDGIENGSDLKLRGPAEVEGPDPTPNERADDPAPTGTQSRQMQDAPAATPPASNISYFGLFLGACSLAAGVMLLVDPHDLRVFHPGRHGGSIEHVTAAGSQAYGILALILGCALCWYALYRPKK